VKEKEARNYECGGLFFTNETSEVGTTLSSKQG